MRLFHAETPSGRGRNAPPVRQRCRDHVPWQTAGCSCRVARYVCGGGPQGSQRETTRTPISRSARDGGARSFLRCPRRASQTAGLTTIFCPLCQSCTTCFLTQLGKSEGRDSAIVDSMMEKPCHPPRSC